MGDNLLFERGSPPPNTPHHTHGRWVTWHERVPGELMHILLTHAHIDRDWGTCGGGQNSVNQTESASSLSLSLAVNHTYLPIFLSNPSVHNPSRILAFITDGEMPCSPAVFGPHLYLKLPNRITFTSHIRHLELMQILLIRWVSCIPYITDISFKIIILQDSESQDVIICFSKNFLDHVSGIVYHSPKAFM